MFIWEIVNEREFSSGSMFAPRKLPRFYLSREKAEVAAHKIAVKAHADRLKDVLDRVDDEEDGEEFDDDEKAWWRSKPAMSVHRTEKDTFYCCGDPQWDSRDRRGIAYGWVSRREVVE